VQIGVSGAAVAVREGRRDHTVGVELGHSLGTHAGERHVVFDVFEGVGDGLIMNIFKGFRQVSWGQRPQHREAFDGAEPEVYPAVDVV
jgi:hypothetical protein